LWYRPEADHHEGKEAEHIDGECGESWVVVDVAELEQVLFHEWPVYRGVDDAAWTQLGHAGLRELYLAGLVISTHFFS